MHIFSPTLGHPFLFHRGVNILFPLHRKSFPYTHVYHAPTYIYQHIQQNGKIIFSNACRVREKKVTANRTRLHIFEKGTIFHYNEKRNCTYDIFDAITIAI